MGVCMYVPCDAVLIRYMPWPCVCLSVSVTSRFLLKRQNESSWFLAWELSSTWKFGYGTFKNKGTFSGSLLPKSGLRKFCNSKSMVLSTILIDG